MNLESKIINKRFYRKTYYSFINSLITIPLFMPLGLTFFASFLIEFIYVILFLIDNLRLKKLFNFSFVIFSLQFIGLIIVSLLFSPSENWKQILRQAPGPILIYVFFTLANHVDIVRRIDYIRYLKILIISVGFIALLPKIPFLPQNISINQIDDLAAQRFFITPVTFFILISPYFIINRNILCSISTLSITFATGSRGALISILLSVLICGNSIRLKRRLQLLFSLIVIVFILNLFSPVTFQRLFTDLDFITLDSKRYLEIGAALLKFIQFPNFIFGLPFTFPYWDGWFLTGNIPTIDNEPQFINSTFDIHNGFVFLLLRFGVLGFILFLNLFIKIFKEYPKYRPTLITFCFLNLVSSGPLYFDGCFGLLYSFMLIYNIDNISQYKSL